MDGLSWVDGHRLVAEVGSETWLVQRIRDERKRQGWNQAELAKRLTAAGHPFGQSAISKLEADKRERGITIDEAIGFSKVFQVPLGELLLPEPALALAAAWHDFSEAADQRNIMRNAQSVYETKLDGLRWAANGSAEFRSRLREYRSEVMQTIEAELRRQHDDENEIRSMRGEQPKRWPGKAMVEANRPPAVVTIDDVLEGVEEA